MNTSRGIKRRSVIIGGVSAIGLLAGCIEMPGDLVGDEGGAGPGEEESTPPQQPIEDPVTEPIENPPVDPPEDPQQPGVGPTELVQYTSVQFSYSVLYPETWTVDESDPTLVIFAPDTGEGFQMTNAFSMPDDITLEELVDMFVQTQSGEVEGLEVLDQRPITLPSGQTAAIVESTYSLGSFPYHELTALLSMGTAVYMNRLVMASQSYTPEFETIANRIAGSLTIHG